MDKEKPDFQEVYDIVREAVYKRRHKWTYQLSWMDFDDVASIIMEHLYRKWHLYDPKQPLLNWVNRVATNKIINLARDNYNTYLPPCASCVCNMGDDSCSIYEIQSEVCPVFKKWVDTKKRESYNINIPLSTENHQAELSDMSIDHLDYAALIPKLEVQAKKILTTREQAVFKLLFVEKNKEEEITKKLNYKTQHQLESVKESIYKKLKKFIYSDDCDIVF